MADFRRCITALALLALFVGIAGAQVNGGAAGSQTQMACNSVVQNVPTIRSEGVTELVGDIVVTCTGGAGIAVGGSIPQVNIIVNMVGTTAVTSRLASTTATYPTATEALLMIDEPNSGLTPVVPGFGPGAGLNLCTTPDRGCAEFVGSQTAGGTTYSVAVDTAGATTAGKNVFQGLLTGTTQITFFGVPVLPPVTTGIQRVFRITNIRVNGAGATAQTVSALMASSAPSSFPVSSASVTVAFVQPSLTTSVTGVAPAGQSTAVTLTSSNATTFTQCNAVTLGQIGFLNFTEKFGNAFKTRIDVARTGGTSFQATTSSGFAAQNVPGQVYNAESGFVMPVTHLTAGLADYGTRLQAVFANVPAGSTVYVSRYNVSSFSTAAGSGDPASSSLSGVGTNPIATLITSTTGGGFGTPSGSSITTISGTNVQVVPVSGTAVWEVIQTNPNLNETLSFAVFITTTPNLTNNQPTPGNAASVTLSYNPIDATPGSNLQGPIPRFVNPNPQASPLLNIAICQTVLLFPYVTSQGGFDTGISIANTSMDPIGTGTSATQQSNGTCTLNFYGAGAPTAALTVPSSTYPTILTFANGATTTPVTNPTTIPAGGQIIFTTASVVPNFQGYMFASCNFQFAHGFAFVSDLGARNLAMGYLALVVNNGLNLQTRGNSSQAIRGEALEN